ncbi:MAG TPA: class I SAM-dependent methyltransferase [Steroidobacteraceae bacterium]|nr:class I SAM-dependent methyltransferase [Steroidobacteraceae bacterium]
MPARRFDRDYYERYYFDSGTAVTTRREMQARARLIAAYAVHVGLQVRRILDAGCGTGMLRGPLKRYLPHATYTGIEASKYLCERYGWQQAHMQTYRSSTPFDVVICYDVMQYLDSATATRAITNLARLCRGVLYFTALTRLDWELNCDRSRTDSDVYLRSAQWYRARLQRGFREAGAGFWLRRGAPLAIWDLESAG